MPGWYTLRLVRSNREGSTKRTAFTRHRSRWVCASLLAPMSLTVQIPQDSLETAPDTTGVNYFQHQENIAKFTLGGGGGKFYREIGLPTGTECAPYVPVEQDYVDVGAEFDYQKGRVGHLGVRGGYVHGDAIDLPDTVQTYVDQYGDANQLEVYYINPFVSFEWKYVGFGAGGIISSDDLVLDDEILSADTGTEIYPTAHLRFGDLSKAYVSAHLLESVPIYSGGGLLVVGLGVALIPHVELYGGWSSEGIYQEDAALARVRVDLNRTWSLMSTLRFPVEYDEPYPDPDSEFGVSIGVIYRSIR